MSPTVTALNAALTYVDISSTDYLMKTCSVEIKDINTQASSFSNLYQPPPFDWSSAFDINGKLIFLHRYDFRNGNPTVKFDIYEVSTDSWKIGVVNLPSYFLGSTWAASSNAIFIAGGVDDCPSRSNCQNHSEVYKLQF